MSLKLTLSQARTGENNAFTFTTAQQTYRTGKHSDTQYTRQNGISNIEHLSLLSTAPWRLMNNMAAHPAIMPDVLGVPTARTMGFTYGTAADAFKGRRFVKVRIVQKRSFVRARIVQKRIRGDTRLIAWRSTGGNDHGSRQDGENGNFHDVNSSRPKSLSVMLRLQRGTGALPD
jgi:hypothetical protein